jgi:tRNA A37 methylthiotransferase MiaB
MSGMVPDDVRTARQQELAAVEEETARRYHESLIGHRLEMLVETPHPEYPGWMRGNACRYAPLLLKTLPELRGKLVPVVAKRFMADALEVEPIPDSI